MRSISLATQQQQTGTDQLAAAMGDILRVTEQSASATKQMVGANNDLSALARDLAVVERFRLAGEARAADEHERHFPARLASAGTLAIPSPCGNARRRRRWRATTPGSRCDGPAGRRLPPAQAHGRAACAIATRGWAAPC